MLLNTMNRPIFVNENVKPDALLVLSLGPTTDK